MSKLDKTRHHKIFRADLKHKVLIVAPQGDAIGFRASDVQNELRTLTALVDDPQVLNLLFDFGRAAYFGSVVIGALSSLGTKVRNAGGRVGICNVSEDMRGALEILKLDALWTEFDTQKSALKSLNV